MPQYPLVFQPRLAHAAHKGKPSRGHLMDTPASPASPDGGPATPAPLRQESDTPASPTSVSPPGGVIRRGMRTVWFRHAVCWVIALFVISVAAIDRTTAPAPAHSSDAASFAWVTTVIILFAIVGLVITLRQWEQVGAAVTISRSLALFAGLLGFVAAVLVYARRWGCTSRPATRWAGWRPARGKHRHGRCLACWPGTRPTWCQPWISPTRWNGRAPPALLTPSSGRASSPSACGSR